MSLLIISLFCIFCFIFQILFLISEKKQKMVLSLFLKGTASLLFILLAVYAQSFSFKSLFVTLTFIGLILDGIADVVFNVRFAVKKLERLSFLSGTLLFFSGHLFYLIALLTNLEKIGIVLVSGAIIACCVLCFFRKILKQADVVYRLYGIVYLSTVSLMATSAVYTFIFNPNQIWTIFYAVGAVLFLLSDILLIYNSFSEKKNYYLRVLSLCVYYLGQLLIATTLGVCPHF